MKFSKRILTVVLALIFMLGLSGCFKARYIIHIHPDGTAEQQVVMIGNAYLQDRVQEQREEFQNEPDMKLEDYSEGDMSGFIASKSYKNLDELNTIKLFGGDKGDKKGIQVYRGWLADKYFVGTPLPSMLHQQGESKANIDMQKQLISKMDLKFELHLPQGVQVNAQNANDIGEDQRTFIWSLNLIQDGSIQLTATLWKKDRIILTAAAFFFLLLLGIFACLKWQKSEGEVHDKWQNVMFIALGVLVFLTALAAYSYFSIPLTAPVEQVTTTVIP
jgi:hypothetical protein